jgi:hypothetical protein
MLGRLGEKGKLEALRPTAAGVAAPKREERGREVR